MTHYKQTNIGAEQVLATATVSSRGILTGIKNKRCLNVSEIKIGQCDGRYLFQTFPESIEYTTPKAHLIYNT